MRIDSIAAQPDRAGRHLVKFSDGSSMKLYPQTVEDLGLFSGLELGEEAYEQLRIEAGKMSAKMRAVRIVAAANVSRSDLQSRLVRKGEDPRQASEAVQWMEDMNLVDDRRTAQQIVERCAAKGYGKSRAKQMLYEKRIHREYWEEVLRDYPDMTDSIYKFLCTKLCGEWDERELKRVIDSLLRKGHSYGQIRIALERLKIDADDLQEDSQWQI